MRRGRELDEWRFHTVSGSEPATVNADLTDALHDICGVGGDLQTAQTIRVELVEGLRREQMLQRIRERLSSNLGPAHRRYTRRAWLELQGRRHTEIGGRLAFDRN